MRKRPPHNGPATIAGPLIIRLYLGHEFGGIIAEVGESVKGWKEGDRVVSETATLH